MVSDSEISGCVSRKEWEEENVRSLDVVPKFRKGRERSREKENGKCQ